MSQRKLISVDKHGGLSAAEAVARALGVHLVRLEDDKGDQIIAASVHSFHVIC